MRNTTIGVGLLGGIALAAALFAPLYVALPSRFLGDWYYMTTQGGILGTMAALLVAVALGFGAAALHPEEPVRSGTSAGLIAAVVGTGLMVSPAMGVEACSDLILTAAGGLGSVEALQRATTDAVIAVVWLPIIAAAAVIAVCPALGAVGGVSFDLWRGVPGRPGRDVRQSWVPLLGLVVAAIGGIPVLVGSESLVSDVLEPLGREVSTVDRIRLSLSSTMLLAWTLGFVCWVVRDAVLVIRARRRTWGVLMIVGSLTVPGLLMAEAVILDPTALMSPLTWAVGGGGGIAVLGTMLGTYRAETFHDPSHRPFKDLLGEAILAGIALLGCGLFSGGSAALTAMTVIRPYAAALSGEELLSAELLVSRVFWLHWGAMAGGFVVAVLLLAAMVPVWWLRSALFKRRG